MGILLLAKIGFCINAIVNTGYVFAGSYFVRTGVRYFQDYKMSVENESMVKE